MHASCAEIDQSLPAEQRLAHVARLAGLQQWLVDLPRD